MYRNRCYELFKVHGIEMPFTLKDAFKKRFCSNFEKFLQKNFTQKRSCPKKAAPFAYYVVDVT